MRTVVEGLPSTDNGSSGVSLENQLLATKLYVPPLRPDAVARQRLTHLLDEGVKGKLTVVSAPAGSGKTTLLSEWSSRSELPVAWVSLDEGDNDVARFLAYLVAALQKVRTGVGENALAAMHSPQPPPMEMVLTALVNEVATIPEDFVLVLDDYHVIENRSVHDAITFLLEYLPPQMHLIVASRTAPPLPLARWLARGQLIELSAEDLRFADDEAASFLNEAMGLDLSANDIAALGERTEGWAAGLQLAALSMRGREDVHSFIETFSGGHRYLLDYLAHEVFEQQPEDVRTFLLETSILERMSGALCDTVTGREDGQAMLEHLERINLFVVALDNERRWYRYHHLFSEFLRRRLHQTRHEQVSGLYLRACEWHERNGALGEAISYALAGKHFRQAADQIERIYVTMMARSEVITLLRWLETLPEDLVRSRPQLCIAYAGTLTHLQQLDGVEPYLRQAEQLLGIDEEDAAGISTYLAASSGSGGLANAAGEVAAMRAILVSVQCDWSGTISWSHRALELLAQDNLYVRTIVASNLARAYRYSGDIEAAAPAFSELMELGRAADVPQIVLHAMWSLAELQAIRGRLQQAYDTCHQALEFAAEYGGRSPLEAWPVVYQTGMAHMVIGEVLREWNDLEAATSHLLEGFELIAEAGSATFSRGTYQQFGYVSLARIKEAQRDTEGALEAIHKASERVRELDTGNFLRRFAEAWRVWLWIRQGDLEAASRWAEERAFSAEEESDYTREIEHLMFARLLMARGEHDEALKLLQRLLQAAETGRRMGTAIEILALKALCLQALSDEARALDALGKALPLAEPEGYVRTFADEGQPMAALLKRFIKSQKTHSSNTSSISLEYVSKLLEAFGVEVIAAPAKTHVRGAASLLVEPLSERELEVLELLDSDLSNREIAARLFVSLPTVKSHTKHIYRKLGVSARHQAVTRAKELGLL